MKPTHCHMYKKGVVKRPYCMHYAVHIVEVCSFLPLSWEEHLLASFLSFLSILSISKYVSGNDWYLNGIWWKPKLMASNNIQFLSEWTKNRQIISNDVMITLANRRLVNLLIANHISSLLILSKLFCQNKKTHWLVLKNSPKQIDYFRLFAVLDVQIPECDIEFQHRNNTHPGHIYVGHEFFGHNTQHLVPDPERCVWPQDPVARADDWLASANVDRVCRQHISHQNQHGRLARFILRHHHCVGGRDEHRYSHYVRRFIR